ncbi:hypothetical protein ACNHE5_12560 [Pandoraea pnomenusa]|uniref:hypothetical protein n=1 Tax=Pandoraea pnomenusa TaxID=93220 RepID=UPI003CF2D59A
MDDNKKNVDADSDIRWARAVLLYQEDGENGELVDLLNGATPVTENARAWLAGIVSGDIKRGEQRGRSNAKLSWLARRQITDGLAKVYRNTGLVMAFGDEIADREAVEPIEVRQKMEKIRRQALAALITRYDMSESGIRKMVNPAMYDDFGRMLAGECPDDWLGTVYEEFSASMTAKRDSWLQFAIGIYESGGDAFDALSPNDPIPL